MTASDTTNTTDMDQQLSALLNSAQIDGRAAAGIAAFRAAAPLVPQPPVATYEPARYSLSGNISTQA